MSLYIPEGAPPVIHGALARIERNLPHAGEILARVGGRVEPEDLVARGLAPQLPQVINIARHLAIPAAQVPKVLQCEIGAHVKKGDLLARLGRLNPTRVLAPINGTVVAVDPVVGYLTLAPEPQPFEVHAAVRGVVMDVSPYSVAIETPAAQIYGLFGVGKERNGVMWLMVTDPSDGVEAKQIEPKHAYAVLICGASITAEALQRAVEQQVRGVIVGGIAEAELRRFLGLSGLNAWQTGVGTWEFAAQGAEPALTIVVTEGFGPRPMSAPIFELLSNHDRQEVLIEGTTILRHGLRRPRVIIPLTRPSSGQARLPRPELAIGREVRIVAADYLGQTAVVRSISAQPRPLASGARSAAVEVSLSDGQRLVLPLSAVEPLEQV